MALKMTNAPITKYDWCAKWVKDVHNSTALRSLNWKTPLEISAGETPDISMFNYYFWESKDIIIFKITEIDSFDL